MAAREVARTPENKVYSKPRLLTDAVMHFCPGCSHGAIHKLIAEVIDEMGMEHEAIGISPVGCGVLAYDYIDIDIMACRKRKILNENVFVIVENPVRRKRAGRG